MKTQSKSFTNRAWNEFQKWKEQYDKDVETSLAMQNRLHEYAIRHSKPFSNPEKAGLILLSYLRGECKHINTINNAECDTKYNYCELCGVIEKA